MRSGRWQPPADRALLEATFRDHPVQPCFYGLEDIAFENRHWPSQQTDVFLGTPDSGAPPGDIDPTRSVLIGDLGPDQPFALDYRRSGTPLVVYLRGSVEPRWITIASSIDQLIEALDL
jgi:hypothetical protein